MLIIWSPLNLGHVLTSSLAEIWPFWFYKSLLRRRDSSAHLHGGVDRLLMNSHTMLVYGRVLIPRVCTASE